jgi:hypothetical protein
MKISKPKAKEEESKSEKIYQVITKGHTCIAVSGKTFGKAPVCLKESELTKEIKADQRLEIEEKK